MNLNATPQFQETNDIAEKLTPEVKKLELNKDTLSAIFLTQEKFEDVLVKIPEDYFSIDEQKRALAIFDKSLKPANDDNFKEGNNSMVA